MPRLRDKPDDLARGAAATAAAAGGVVVVTGYGGAIGSALARRLRERYTVVGRDAVAAGV